MAGTKKQHSEKIKVYWREKKCREALLVLLGILREMIKVLTQLY